MENKKFDVNLVLQKYGNTYVFVPGVNFIRGHELEQSIGSYFKAKIEINKKKGDKHDKTNEYI